MYEYAIKEIVKVVDGDTIDITIDLGFDLTKKERVRLVKTEKDGKYGRMLGWLHCGKTNINLEMIYRGYAWEYDGGTKKKDLNDLRSKRVKQ